MKLLNYSPDIDFGEELDLGSESSEYSIEAETGQQFKYSKYIALSLSDQWEYSSYLGKILLIAELPFKILM